MSTTTTINVTFNSNDVTSLNNLAQYVGIVLDVSMGSQTVGHAAAIITNNLNNVVSAVAQPSQNMSFSMDTFGLYELQQMPSLYNCIVPANTLTPAYSADKYTFSNNTISDSGQINNFNAGFQILNQSGSTYFGVLQYFSINSATEVWIPVCILPLIKLATGYFSVNQSFSIILTSVATSGSIINPCKSNAFSLASGGTINLKYSSASGEFQST